MHHVAPNCVSNSKIFTGLIHPSPRMARVVAFGHSMVPWQFHTPPWNKQLDKALLCYSALWVLLSITYILFVVYFLTRINDRRCWSFAFPLTFHSFSVYILLNVCVSVENKFLLFFVSLTVYVRFLLTYYKLRRGVCRCRPEVNQFISRSDFVIKIVSFFSFVSWLDHCLLKIRCILLYHNISLKCAALFCSKTFAWYILSSVSCLLMLARPECLSVRGK